MNLLLPRVMLGEAAAHALPSRRHYGLGTAPLDFDLYVVSDHRTL
jgi:hypothetical protein